MAIAPGSYSFMGGAVLGKGSEGQFVLVRSGSLLTAFTDDEYNACLEAVHDGKAVCVQYTIGSATFQIQLLNVTGAGSLQFVESSPDSVMQYRVSGISPHTVSIVKSGGAQQFVLERDDMSTAFTASEYLQCQTRISEGTAVCVQWKSGSARMQAQLATMLADGSLLFSLTTVGLETIYIVAGSDPHNITAHTNSLGGGGDQFVLVRADMTTQFTNTEYQDCVDAVTAGQAVCVQYGSNQIQLGGISGGALVFTQSAPGVITKYTVSPLSGLHTISAERKAVGVPIYGSLQDAIADEFKLPIGTYFETNGFHTTGDGGGARYLVSSTGTANGMDIVQLSAGKLAALQVENGEIYPEQLGAICNDNSQDLTGIFNRAQAMTEVKTIRLHAKRYWFNGIFTITKTNLSIIGTCEYSDSSDYTELTSRRTGDFFIEVEAPNVSIENLSLANRSNGGSVWTGDDVRLYGGVGIASRLWSDDASHYNLKFKNLRLISFRTGIELAGKVKWQITFDNIRAQQCYIGIDLVETAFAVEFDLLHTDRCSYCGLRIFGDTNAILNNCNLGSVKSAVRVENWHHAGEPNPYHNTQLIFNSCNFEVDNQSIANCSGMYVYTENTIDCILSFNGCRFTQNQATGTLTNNCFSFGDNTVAKFEDCELRRNHSSYNPSLFFDSARPTKQEVGSLIITGNNVDLPSPSYSDVYKPVLMRDDSEGNGLINFNANTNFIDNYGNARKGKLLFNTDTNTLYTYINGVLCKIDHEPGGSDNYVMIGGESYPVVTINGLKWIATNLNLQTTNSVLLTGHESDFRQYYPDGDFSEITAALPSGWRIPTRADWQQLQPESPSVTNSGWAYWSTLYPAELPNATNTTGFSATPSRTYDSADHDRVMYWTTAVSGTSHVAYGLLKDNGYGYGGMDGKKLCIRVCCDA